MFRETIDRLEIVLKLTERCNLNCDYCYFFNGGDQSYLEHPARLSAKIAGEVADYIARSLASGEVRSVQVDFHGGEPLLIGKVAFANVCKALQKAAHAESLSLCLQTNSTLVDDDWIDLFEEFSVKVSTSLDGPKHLHDVHRVNHAGHSSYDHTIRGINKLMAAYKEGRITSFGCLCVIDPSHSPREIYHHLVHDLGFTLVDFLLPDHTHDSFPFISAANFGKFLCNLFDSWAEDNNPELRIRILQSVVSLLMGGRSFLMGFGPNLPKALTVTTSGAIQPDDFLRTCYPELMNTGLALRDSSAWTALYSKTFSDLQEASTSLPDACGSCAWNRVCCGGQMTHRFSRARQFNNSSVYCEALKMLYSHSATYLLANGMRIEWLESVLLSEPRTKSYKPSHEDVFGHQTKAPAAAPIIEEHIAP